MIPKLGQLRQLPLVESSSDADPRDRGSVDEPSRLAQAGFGVAGLVATGALLVAAFCGIRWALIEVPATSDEHIATIRERLSERSASELVREYEDMEKRGLELGVPFRYKEIAVEKAEWGRDASIAGAIGAAALALAFVCAMATRRNRA
ncbi:MAG: hypothetical protein ACR2NZ_12340 [Rubripirellula sp.]